MQSPRDEQPPGEKEYFCMQGEIKHYQLFVMEIQALSALCYGNSSSISSLLWKFKHYQLFVVEIQALSALCYGNFHMNVVKKQLKQR
jgi:hypothetical protein